jgi:hypothetical protein
LEFRLSKRNSSYLGHKAFLSTDPSLSLLSFKNIGASHIMLQKTERETKSPRPLCQKQEFYYSSILRGDKFSKP